MKKVKSLAKVVLSVMILGFVFVTIASLFPNSNKGNTKINLDTIQLLERLDHC